MIKPRLLLHACCAPCSIYVLQKLEEQFKVTVFFYDPNIHPRSEYNLRRDELKKYCLKIGLQFIEGEYNSRDWFNKTKHLASEPEKGRRCELCFDLRLAKTAAKAKAKKYAVWATVLTISPHKNAKQINTIGNRLALDCQVPFLDTDWKKNDGFKIANKLSQQAGFYRQNYCGCLYSRAQKLNKKILVAEKNHEYQII